MDFLKRPVAVSTLTMFISFCIFANLALDVKPYHMWSLGAVAAVLILSSFIPKLNRKISLGLRYLFLALLGIFFSLVLVLASFSDKDYRKYESTEVYAECTVTDVLWKSESGTCYKVRVHKAAEDKTDFYAALRSHEKYEIGDILSGKIYFSRLKSSEYFDSKKYYMSKGVVLTCEDSGIEITGKAEETWFFALKRLQGKLSANMGTFMSEERASLANAVVLGEKKGLSSEVKRDFSKIGISHLIAISGMHVSYISSAFHGITKKLYAGKKLSAFLCIFLMLFYMGLTGFSASVVRASLLCCLMSVLIIIGKGNDGVTALGVCGCVMITVCPHFAYDVGMQLSFAAYLGCLAAAVLNKRIKSFAAEKFPEVSARLQARRLRKRSAGICSGDTPPEKALMSDMMAQINTASKSLRGKKKTAAERALVFMRKQLSALGSSVLFTLTVTVFTLPVMWFHYDTISIAAPLANLLFIPLFSIIMYLGIGVMLLSPVPYLGEALGFVSDKFISFVLFLSEKISEENHLTVSLNYNFAPIVIALFFLCLMLLLFSKRKTAVAAMAGICICAAVYGFGIYAHDLGYRDVVRVGRLDCKGGEAVIILSEGSAALCDASIGSASQASVALEQVFDLCETEIDTLILTKYTQDHIHLTKGLAENTYLKTVYLPKASGKGEIEIKQMICAVLENSGATVYSLSDYPQTVKVGAADIEIFSEIDGGVGFAVHGAKEAFLCLPSDFDNENVAFSVVSNAERCFVMLRKSADARVLKKAVSVFGEENMRLFSTRSTGKINIEELFGIPVYSADMPAVFYLK